MADDIPRDDRQAVDMAVNRCSLEELSGLAESLCEPGITVRVTCVDISARLALYQVHINDWASHPTYGQGVRDFLKGMNLWADAARGQKP